MTPGRQMTDKEFDDLASKSATSMKFDMHDRAPLKPDFSKTGLGTPSAKKHQDLKQKPDWRNQLKK